MIRSLLLAFAAAPFALLAQPLNKPKLAVRNWATGFTQPVAIVNCGDDRLFVVQKAGVIKIVSDSMTVDAVPFLDITDRVNSSNNEQGLLGLAFEPNYQDSGYFYVYYTHGDPYYDRVSRFRVTDDPNVADPNSEQVLIDVPDPEWNHNGGDLHFGQDGYLYIGFGDGGSGNDPWNNGQNYTEPLGGMFRIDVSEHNDHYLIPPTNPFSYETGTDTLPELWAVGLRNPWRYSFDRLTGDLWIGDVGQNTWEEVDKWPADGNTCPNFGWRCREAFVATPGVSQTGCQGASAYVSPLAAFNHSSQGWCSVIGGYVYRGGWYPHHYGHYIFTDYCAGDFLTFSDETNTDVDTMLMTTTAGYAAFGEDAEGQLYVANQVNGQLKKIYDPCPMNDPEIISQGDTALVATAATGYQWYLNGVALTGQTDQLLVPEVTGNYQVVCNFGAPCSLISDTLLFVIDGVNDMASLGIHVYPQPAKDELIIERTSGEAGAIQLLDGTGRVVHVLNWQRGQVRLRVDVAGLPEGPYFLRAFAADGSGRSAGSLIIAH